MRRVLVVGCGNIGYRHLQALAALEPEAAADLMVIEPDVARHPQIDAAFGRLPQEQRERSSVLSELPKNTAGFDLAVFATNSAQRRQAYDSARASCEFATAVFEKVLFPRLRDIDEVGEDLDRAGITAFVNCGRRVAPGYAALKGSSAGRGPIVAEVTGTAYGLASNAVHFLDLAEFMNGSPITSLDASGLQPGHEQSKRNGYIEVFGTITATLVNGASISVRCDRGEVPRVEVQMRCDGDIFCIDEAARTIRTPQGGNPATFAMRQVSELTETYAGLLAHRTCCLTPYGDSARQHRYFLGAILSHIGRPATADEICPIS